MMKQARLPVAPRPYRDELLSSWMARMACRYGLTAQEMAGCFGGEGNSSSSPTSIDDSAPATDQTRVWARACGVDPDRLHRLSLSWRFPHRSREWYLNRGPEWSPSTVTGSTPVCLACLDADRSNGRDGCLRASWMFAELCICPLHGQLLIDRCLSCHRHLSVAFRMIDGRAGPVCGYCNLILTGRGGEGSRPPDRNLVRAAFAVQQRITESVDHEKSDHALIEKALATLWAPLDHPGAARPVLALWFNEAGWRCPYDVRHAVGAKTPLGQLAMRWRLVTLLALNDVFGTRLGADGELTAAAAHLVQRAARRREYVSPPRQRAHVHPQKRSSAEYERLARHILADPRWIAAEKLPWRKRERVRAGLIDAALTGDSTASGVRLPSSRTATGSLINSDSASLTIMRMGSHNRAQDFDLRRD